MSNKNPKQNHEEPIEEEIFEDQEEATTKNEENIENVEKPKMISITEIEYERLNNEAVEHKDKYLRLLAEQENTRKRLQKERDQLIQFAVQNAIADFLAPLDHFENALKFTEQMSEEIKHWGLGFQMILNQFKEVLSNNGIQQINSVGTKMDPHMHEVIETIETNEFPPGIILEESVKGYRMGDKIIRPARVKVSKAPKANNDSDKVENINEEST